MGTTRLLASTDIGALVELVQRNRAFLAPWEPVREDHYFTPDGQQALFDATWEQYQLGQVLPHVITDSSGLIVGRITLTGIERGSFQSCRLGYFVAEECNGRGLATAAIGEMIQVAFAGLGLHRIEAGTLLHNHASQRALVRNGFRAFGTAPAYLNIAGRWQDHALFQLVAEPRQVPD